MFYKLGPRAEFVREAAPAGTGRAVRLLWANEQGLVSTANHTA